MKNLTDLFKIIKRGKFLEDYAKINPTGGISHRFAGINPQGKESEGLTDQDKQQIKEGIDAFAKDLQTVRNSF